MATETSTQSYSEKWYRYDRYTNESEPFHWYQKYSSLAPLINLYVPQRNHRILVIGCGNSDLKMDVHDMKAYKGNLRLHFVWEPFEAILNANA